MFDVAFSRRICCSRVAKVKTKPLRPCLSYASPTSRPGICRAYLSRVANRSDVWPTKRNRHAKRLAFGDDDIRAACARRLQQSKRNRLSHRHHHQSAGGVCFFRQRSDVFNATKKIWRLNYQRRRLVVQKFSNICRRLARFWIGLGMDQLDPRMLYVGVNDFQILRMNRATRDNLAIAW